MSGPSDGPRHLVLVGLMGAGKTSVGERCAARLGRPFVDTDDLVEATAHMTVAEIFDTLGEAQFRELERAAVADVSASPDPLVIACGGGAVLDAQSRTRLRATGVVVWLQAPAAELSERVDAAATERPLLRGGTAVSTLERLAAVRAPAYEAAAHVVVDTSGRSLDEVASLVVGVYQRELDSTGQAS
jgi:shikimate kinase